MNFNNNLYNEILKYEKSPMKLEEFVAKLIESSEVRNDFIQEYVDEIIDSMDLKEIKKAYSRILVSSLNARCDLNQEDAIAKECFNQFPYVMDRFGVDVAED